jgi:Holliday junction resolvase RusA-like endonuclease
MKWTAIIDGQPPSVNDIYTIGWRVSGTGRRYKGIVKKPEATAYQSGAQLQFQTQKPSHWKPTGFIRLTYRFYLNNDADCDNLKKLLHDALQAATGINDTWFLTTDQFKVKAPRNKARVEIDIDDEDPESPSLPLEPSPAAPPSQPSTSSWDWPIRRS